MGNPQIQITGGSTGVLTTLFKKYRLTPTAETFSWVTDELRRITDYLWELTDQLTEELEFQKVLEAGITTGLLSGNAVTTEVADLTGKSILVGIKPATDVVPTVMAHVTLVAGSAFTVRFTKLSDGTEDTLGTYDVYWGIYGDPE